VSPPPTTSPAIDPARLQGWVVRGYTLLRVRHLIFEVVDAASARRLLGAVTGDDPSLPQVTSAAPWPTGRRPDRMLNLGFTHAGLEALGLPAPALASFPSDFRQGAVDRAAKLGDTGESGPEHWRGRLGETDVVHVHVAIHAADDEIRDDVTDRLLDAGRGGVRGISRFDGGAFPGGVVHFGYRDGIAQPRIEGLPGRGRPDGQPTSPPGAFLLGHPSQFEGVRFTVPDPEVLGHEGNYNAFRVLQQDVAAFDRFLVESSATSGLDRDLVAAKLLGRWPDGDPLVLRPDGHDEGDQVLPDTRINDFGYADDPEGLACPIGSHIRRANPRDSRVVQRGFGSTRRLVRRGMPYGPQYEPGSGDDGIERGLLGNFMCASLSAQFEAVMYDWVNLGLQHPDITGLNDPLLGDNDERTSRFDIPTANGTCTLRGFPRFVTTRGSAYTFIPSLPALRYLAAG
jgi:deferrochelatase/peroxidase EfeB